MTIENCEKFFSAYTEAERAALVQLIYFSEKLFQERSEIRKRCQARVLFWPIGSSFSLLSTEVSLR